MLVIYVYQAITCIATSKLRTDWHPLVELTSGELAVGDTAEWREEIPVPQLVPSDLIHCDIMNVKYYVAVRYLHVYVVVQLSN